MPNRRPDEPIAPATIPGRPLDPKIPLDQQADNDTVTDEHGNEILSASLHRTPPETSRSSLRRARTPSSPMKPLPTRCHRDGRHQPNPPSAAGSYLG